MRCPTIHTRERGRVVMLIIVMLIQRKKVKRVHCKRPKIDKYDTKICTNAYWRKYQIVVKIFHKTSMELENPF